MRRRLVRKQAHVVQGSRGCWSASSQPAALAVHRVTTHTQCGPWVVWAVTARTSAQSKQRTVFLLQMLQMAQQEAKMVQLLQRNEDGLKELLLKVAATTYFLSFLAAVEVALAKLSY